MAKKRKFITVGIAIAAAGAAAHIMQSNDTRRSVDRASVASVAAAPVPVPRAPDAATKNDVVIVATPSRDDPLPAALPEPQAPAVADALPRPPAEALTPTPLPQTGQALARRMAGLDTAAAAKSDPLAAGPARNQFGLTCGPILSATAARNGMAALTLTAPCRGDERITVRHGALEFSARLDHLGTYSTELPALQTDATFAVVFADGARATSKAEIPGADRLARAAVMFRGDAGLQLHALEFGAAYDGPGHVWSGTPGNPDAALERGGGYLVRLGDPALDDARMAEVYTFPADNGGRTGVVRVSVEAEVTEANCGTEVAGRSIEATGFSVQPVEITVAMPGCDAVGEYLVLKNILRDLKIAAN